MVDDFANVSAVSFAHRIDGDVKDATAEYFF
jgi:hypothetical protein